MRAPGTRLSPLNVCILCLPAVFDRCGLNYKYYCQQKNNKIKSRIKFWQHNRTSSDTLLPLLILNLQHRTPFLESFIQFALLHFGWGRHMQCLKICSFYSKKYCFCYKSCNPKASQLNFFFALGFEFQHLRVWNQQKITRTHKQAFRCTQVSLP